MNKIIFITLILLTNSCIQTKEIQFGTYNYVGSGGLYGETLIIKADSTFIFSTEMGITSTLAGGKLTKRNNRFYLYDIENLLKLIIMDSIIIRDTQYLNFPNDRKKIVLPPKVIYRYYGNEQLSHKVPNSVAMKRQYLCLFDNNNKVSGKLKLFKKDTVDKK